MRDYANRYYGVAVNRQRVSGRKASVSGRERSFRLIGVVSVVAMLLGIGSSIWFGVALQDNLRRLDQGKQEKLGLNAANVVLSAEKERLLQKGRVEKAAEGLGLFPPSGDQLRRP